MLTSKDTVKVLSKSVLIRLENQKIIELDPSVRQTVVLEIYDVLKNLILTEQDIREQALEKIGESSNLLNDIDLNDNVKYKAARAVVKNSFGDDVLNGMYFQKNLRDISKILISYFMKSDYIDEVFETDEEIEKKIISIIKHFDPSKVH